MSIFLTDSPPAHGFFIIDISFMLKDNVDDIHEKLQNIPITKLSADPYATDRQAIFKKYTGTFISQPILISYEALRQY